MEHKINWFQAGCIWIGKLTHIPEQIIRFLIIGCINTAFAYGLYALFIFIGLHYTLAVLLANIIGICFSFKTLGTLVFDNPDNSRIIKFFSVYIIGYFLNIGILRLLSATLLPNLYWAGMISSLLVAMFSFCANKYFVFRKK